MFARAVVVAFLILIGASDLVTGEIIRDDLLIKKWKGHERYTWCVAFSPDGKFLVTGGDEGRIIFWDVDTWEKVKEFQPFDRQVRDIEFDADGDRFVALGGIGEKFARVYNTSNLDAIPGLEDITTSGFWWSATIGPAGDNLATVSSFQYIRTNDSHGTKWRNLWPNSVTPSNKNMRVSCCKYSPDGQVLVRGGNPWVSHEFDSEYDVFLEQSGSIFMGCVGTKPDPNREVHDLVFSDDASYLAVVKSDRVRLYATKSWVLRDKFDFPPASYRRKSDFSPFGPLLAVTDHEAGTYIWDISDLRESSKWSDLPVIHIGSNSDKEETYDVSFSPDGQYMATAEKFGYIRVWSVAEFHGIESPMPTMARPDDFIAVDNQIPQSKNKNPDAIAVVIGNCEYENIPSVDFACNDAEVIVKYLVKVLGYREENVFKIENADIKELENMFGNARSHQGKIFWSIKPDKSDLFVYYSGHGAPELNSGEQFLIPVDGQVNNLNSTGYSLGLLYRNLAATDARSITVVIDACFSGMTPAGTLVEGASPAVVPTKEMPFGGDARFTVLTAGTNDQIASWYTAGRHGLFTYYLLAGLRGLADDDGDDRITLAELESYVTSRSDGVPYLAGRIWQRVQQPQFFSNDKNSIMVNLK